MLRFEWSKAVKRPSRVVLRARRRGPRSPWTRFVPRLDPMENRTLLSSFTVTSDADNNNPKEPTLRAGIASGADTIVFALPSHDTIKLTLGELKITKSLNIKGPGADKLTISGNKASRVFEIGSGATVTLANLTIANGQTFSAGTSGDALGGGGILNDAGATLNLTRCSVVNNQAVAPDGSGLDVFGGGLLNLGTANVTASTFTGNQVLDGASSTFFGGSVGGAIDNFGGATLIVTASTFSNNQAKSAVSAVGYFFGVGGAIENNAGFDQAQPSTATISNSTFTDNQAIGGGTQSSGNGGAIDNEGTGATMTLTNCRLIDNLSIGGAENNGLGGGILNLLGTLTVNSSTLSGNQAKGGPDGTELFNSLGEGGGILNAGGTAVLTVNDSMLFGNQAVGGTTTTLGGGDAIGGGIENTGTATLYLNKSTLSGNQAIAGSGRTNNNIFPRRGLAAGGGLDESYSSHAFITSCLFINNQALGSAGGGLGVNGGDGLGGGIAVGISDFLGDPSDASSLSVRGSTLTGNQAIGGAGGSGATGGNGQGGGIWFGSDSTGTLDNSVITGNFALGGQAGAGGSDGQGRGGGLYIDGATVTATRTLIKKNSASTDYNDLFGTLS